MLSNRSSKILSNPQQLQNNSLALVSNSSIKYFCSLNIIADSEDTQTAATQPQPVEMEPPVQPEASGQVT